MKRTLLTIILALLIVPMAFAIIGVNNPTPAEIELKAGEEGRFRFAIQAMGEEKNMKCSVVTERVNPDLEIVYDDGTEFEVKAGTIKPVLASITPGSRVEAGRYEQDFCVECSKIGDTAGIATKPRFCTTKVVVDVVELRTKENFPIPQKPAPESSGLPLGTILGVAVAVIAILAVLVALKMRKPKRAKSKKKRK